VSDRDGDFEIYVMNADGTGQTRITNNSVFDQYPSWSPDGTKIALASTHDGNREIYTMSADGTNLARLTVTITGTEESPSWGEAFRRIGLASVGASVSRTMAVENRGGAPLTVSHIASSDPQFTISPTSFTVTPGGSQNVAITFTPTSAGAKYATLTITSNDADAPAIRLIVNGTGRGPAIFLFSSALSFGSVKIGTSSAQTFTMSNTGTEPLSVNSISSGNPLFTASPTSFSLAPGASQRVTVTFAPTGVGSQTGTLSISHGAAESPATVALSGAGTNQTLSLSSTLLFFDSVSVGSSATRMFTVFNTGAGMLSVSSITSSDPQFTVSPASFTVEAQADTVAASQVVTVTFTPASTGQQTGKLTLLHNAAGSPSTISLLGAGVVGQPILSLSSTSLSFGNVAVGSSATRMFTISNTGTVALSVGSITSSNPQFTVSPASFTVAARAGTVASSQTVTVTFTPTGAGPHTGALVIPHNAPGSPDPLNTARSLALVSLSGTGAPSGPAISLSTASLSFGGVNIGSSATRMFTISNSGTAALSVGSIASSNPLFTVSPASFTVAAQASTVASSQTVTVTFTPTGAGSQTGALTIPHNAAGSPSSISLSGVGVDSTAPDLQIAAKIAFTSDNAIYTINANGTGLTRLTSDLASVHENHPSWSPDGAKIAFNGIYVMNADGTNRNRLSNISMFDQEPSWSPGGTKIAFFTDRDGNPEIYAMNADGTGQTNLTNNSAFDLYPSWSPDGTRIAFVSRRDGNDKIYVMNADGTNLTRLTNDQAVDGDPSWSPDGTRIVFTRNYNDIYMMNADGTNLTRLTSGASPSWSPDGTKIAFRSYYDGNADIAVINADGTGQTRLTYHQPGTLGSSYAPSWGEAFRRIGSTAVGTPVSRTMTIENRGRSTLSVTNITSSDAQFTVSPTSFTVPTSGSQNVTITFNPTSAGTKYTTLTITSNDGDAPTVRLIVNGTGAGDFVSRPDRLDFGNVAVGAAVPLPLTLYNRGSDTLRIDSLRVTPPSSAFTVAAPAPNFIIAPGDSQAVSVSFRPSASGDVAASLTASTSDPDHRTLSIPLRGTGVPLTLSVDLNPAEGDQRQTRMYSVRPGAQIPVQVFVDGAPSIKGFSLQIAFDPRTLAFVPGSFVPGPLVPGLIGLANVQKGYVEVGGTTLEGGTGGGSGLLGTLTFSVLQEFDRETRLSIPLVVWNRVTGGRQAIQTDVHVTFTKFSNSIDPPVGGAPAPDFSRDGKVDFDDFFLFAAAFGSSNAQFDLDGDGAVGFSDFFIFAEAFGK
jgi:Tol biopolymer transport system component